jgi:hypothetical protein
MLPWWHRQWSNANMRSNVDDPCGMLDNYGHVRTPRWRVTGDLLDDTNNPTNL